MRVLVARVRTGVEESSYSYRLYVLLADIFL